MTAFFATLQSPVTPFLPSFWAGESLFAALRGRVDSLHLGALWTTALALTVLARAAYGRYYFAAWSKAQEARKARFTRLALLEPLVRRLPLSPARRALLVKDLKVFLRDTTQWSQLLLLLALAVVYVYNFRVLDLDRIPYMSRVIKNAYAFVNLAMAAFVTSAVAVRFVFPAVSAEGPAFWIVRTAARAHVVVPVVEALDRPRPHPAPRRGPHRGLQPAPRRAALPEAPRRRRHRLHDLRPRGPRLRHGRPTPALRRGEPDPGRRLLRRRRLHGPGRALHPRHGGPPRLARVASTSGTSTAACAISPAPSGSGWPSPSRRPSRSSLVTFWSSMRRGRPGPRGARASRATAVLRSKAEMKRNPTRSVRVGSVFLGAGHPVAVQSMCATRTQDVDATVEQAEAIRKAGGALVRVAVDSPKDVEALAEVRRQTTANLVVDLQENYRLAETVAPHVDKVRYNPGHL